MPLIDIEENSNELPINSEVNTPAEQEARELRDPSLLEIGGAAFRQSNMVGSLLSSETLGVDNYYEEGFKAWDKIKSTDLEPHWDRFLEVQNQKRFDAVAKQIRMENEDKKNLAVAGWTGVGFNVLASIFDLPTLAPGGVLAKGISTGAKIGKSAVSVGTAAAGATAIQELGLQTTQQTRSISESIANVGASAVLGAILGAGSSALLTPIERAAAEKSVDNLMSGLRDVDNALQTAPTPQAGGAAVVNPERTYYRSDVTVAGKAAQAVVNATSELNPNLRLNVSPSTEARVAAQKLAENTLYQNMNDFGQSTGPAAETTMRINMVARMQDAVENHNVIYSDMKKAGVNMRRGEFEEAIGRAMRRGDAGENEFVTRAAQEWRKRVFEPFKKEAIDAGLLPKDVSVSTADSYFTRMWNPKRLEAEETRFKGIVREWARGEAKKSVESFSRASSRRIEAIDREIRFHEINKLRRAEEAKLREDGREADIGDLTEDDIRRAVQLVRSKQKPKAPETLTQWLQKQGGLIEDGGELQARGISNKTRPGFVRKTRKTMQNKDGGYGHDDAARAAWEAGFFPYHNERPSIDEFLDALDQDFNKLRPVVREADEEAMRAAAHFDDIEAMLSRMGVDPAAPRFATSDEMKNLVSTVRKAMDAEADVKISKLKDKIKSIEEDVEMKRRQDFDEPDNFEAYSNEVAEAVWRKLTGRELDVDGLPENVVPLKRGPLKERTFNIPDELVEDFLNSNINEVGQRYSRVMSAEIELTKKFGSVDMKEQFDKIAENYQKLRDGVQSAKTADDIRKVTGKDFSFEKIKEKFSNGDSLETLKSKAISFLKKSEKDDVDDLKHMRDLLRGTSSLTDAGSNFAAISRMAASYNYIRLMGGSALASISEIFRPIAVHGLSTYFNAGIAPLFSKAGRAAYGLSVAEAKKMGLVAERVLQHRLMTMAEIGDPYKMGNAVEKFLENGVRIASKWNGLSALTDMQKSISAVMSQDRIINALLHGENERLLAYLGIDKNIKKSLADTIRANSEKIDGVWVANTQKWGDENLVSLYRAAVAKDVNSIITTRSVGDVPLLANTPAGRLLLQFKTFALASHQRVLLRGLQEDSKQFLASVLPMTVTGMMVSYLRAWRGGQERLDKLSDNPGYWIGEGLDATGILSLPMEVSNLTEKMIGVNPIKSPLKAAFPSYSQSGSSQRYASRSPLEALLGPSASLIDLAVKTANLTASAASGEATDAQKKELQKKLMQLLPYNSYPGARELGNALRGDFPRLQ